MRIVLICCWAGGNTGDRRAKYARCRYLRAGQSSAIWVFVSWGPLGTRPGHTGPHWPVRQKYSWRHAPPLSCPLLHHLTSTLSPVLSELWQSDRVTELHRDCLWWSNCEVRLLVWVCSDQNCQNIFLWSNYFQYFYNYYLQHYELLLIVDLRMRAEIVWVLYCVNNITMDNKWSNIYSSRGFSGRPTIYTFNTCNR